MAFDNYGFVDCFYPRTMKDGAHPFSILEHSKPLRPIWKDIVASILFLGFLVVLTVAL